MIRGATKLIYSIALIVAALPTLAEEEPIVRFRALTPEGTPVANAPIFWLPCKDELRTTFAGEHERSTTDAEGYCTVDFSTHPDVAGNNFEVCVEPGNGYAGILRVYPTQKMDDPTIITVEKRVPIQGRIRAEDGTPVVGALLGSSWFPRSTTDENGRFTIWGIGTSGTLSIFKEGFAWTLINSAKGEMDIVLQRGFSVTFEAVDASEAPLAGTTIHYRGTTIMTDDAGRARSLPMPRGERFYVQAWHGEGETYRAANSGPLLVSGETPQVVRLVLIPSSEVPTASISGRVVMAGTGEAVRARIFVSDNLQEFDYYGRSEAETAKDGTFTVEGVRLGQKYIQARPTKSTLYGSDGIVRVDCSQGSVEGVELQVVPGLAVSGRIKMSDGSEPSAQWVSLRHGGVVRQFPSERGHFQFFNLPPGSTEAVLQGEGGSLTVALGEAGTALRDVTLILAAPSAKGHIRGRIVNRKGEGLPGVSVGFHITRDGQMQGAETGNTNGEGRFDVETEHSGTVTVNGINFDRQISRGDRVERLSFRGTVVGESPSAPLAPGGAAEDLNVVVDIPELVSIAGTVQDEQGNPLLPDVQILTGPWHSSTPREAASNGTFNFYTLPDERFAIIFELPGHQVRILEEGRNFQRGDQEIKVVLPTTPYPEDVPLWTTITGAPWTAEAVEQSIQGDPIRRRFDEFKRLLNADSPGDSMHPVKTTTRQPSTIPIRVVNEAGVPVTRITLHPAAYYPEVDSRHIKEVVDAFPMPGAAATIRTNPEGIYDVPLHHFIWADGTSRALTGDVPAPGETSPREIALGPAHTVRIQVEYPNGTATPDIGVTPYRGYLQQSMDGELYSLPKTDASGALVLEGLPAGRFVFLAFRRNSDINSRLFLADLTRSTEVSVKVVFGPYAEDSDDALLDRLQDQWRNSPGKDTISTLWQAQPRKDRKRILSAATARLAQPILADIASLPFLSSLAVEAKMKDTVPAIMRNLPYLPNNSGWQYAPVIANALADLAGNASIDYFVQATNRDTDPRTRLSAVVAMNRIGTPESLAAWRTLRDSARALPNAPQEKSEYTHGERMAEAMTLVLGYLSGTMMPLPNSTESAQVAADYATGRIWLGNTDYGMRRYGDEWVPVEIGSTVME